MALGAIAHAELDAEIDAEADEEHRKGQRNRIVGSHGQKAEGRRDAEPDHEGEENGEDDPDGSEGEPEQQRHPGDGQDRIEQEALGEGAEFLIGERDAAGQPHPDAMLRGQPELAGVGADGIRGLGARLQRVVVEGRLHQDEAAQFSQGRLRAGEERAPGEGMELAAQHVGDRVGDGDDRPLEIPELGLATLHPLQEAREDVHQAAQAGIGRQGPQQRLGRDELIGQMLDIGGRQEQQAVALEEYAAVGPIDDGEQLRMLLQPRRQRRGRLLGELRA